MSLLSLDVAEDATTLTASMGGVSAQLTASEVDALIRRLAAHRARMKPVHPAEPPLEPGTSLKADNLLWCVRSAPRMSALELGIQHAGLGWITISLSRAQVEDLQTSLAFSLNDLQPVRPRPSG